MFGDLVYTSGHELEDRDVPFAERHVSDLRADVFFGARAHVGEAESGRITDRRKDGEIIAEWASRSPLQGRPGTRHWPHYQEARARPDN